MLFIPRIPTFMVSVFVITQQRCSNAMKNRNLIPRHHNVSMYVRREDCLQYLKINESTENVFPSVTIILSSMKENVLLAVHSTLTKGNAWVNKQVSSCIKTKSWKWMH
jgi:hypothetical protein